VASVTSRTGPLRIQVREHLGAVLVRPTGVLDVATYPQLRDALLKCATDEPSAVVVDVRELAVASVYSLTVFSMVWMHLAQWPGIPLLLVVTDADRRAHLAATAIGRFVPVHPDLETAMESIGYPPPRRRDRLALAAAANSSGVARQFVRRICRRWGVPSVAEDAAAVATELVENVVQHTTSPAELRLELRKGLLSVAVSDNDPRPAILREAVSRAAPSAGLAIVARLARTWGCTPTTKGKIVWAVLRAA
jgi:anti-anti-sigma factor